MPIKDNKDEIDSALKNFDFLPDSAFVRKPVVRALFSISPATLERRIKAGLLPAPEKFSERIAAFNVGKLRRVLEAGGVHA